MAGPSDTAVHGYPLKYALACFRRVFPGGRVQLKFNSEIRGTMSKNNITD
jgi:hypothetical protein